MSDSFSGRLREEMLRKNLSQSALARKIGVSQPTVHAWLQGSEPRMSQYRRLLAVFPSLMKLEAPS